MQYETRSRIAMGINRRADDLMMLPVDWNPANMPEVALVEIKHDGIHAGFRADRTHAFTREGNDLTCADHLRTGLALIEATLMATYGQPHVLFGEYMNPAGFEATLGDVQRGVGTGLIVIFEAVPVSVWEGREAGTTQMDRSMRLAVVKQQLHSVLRSMGVVIIQSKPVRGDARDNIELMAGVAWEANLEGVVVKDANALFTRGPSPAWQRIKRKVTVDVPIVAVELREQLCGPVKAVQIRTAEGVLCKVGVGFSERERADVAAFRPGRIMEVSHLGLTKNGALRSPAFLRFRDDKGAR